VRGEERTARSNDRLKTRPAQNDRLRSQAALSGACRSQNGAFERTAAPFVHTCVTERPARQRFRRSRSLSRSTCTHSRALFRSHLRSEFALNDRLRTRVSPVCPHRLPLLFTHVCGNPRSHSLRSQVLSSQLAPDDDDEDAELDSSELGVVETYRRLFSTLKLPCVQTLLLILLTYRLPTSLSDNVKNLKYLELGLPKSALALMSPTVILPLGILTPILASRFYSGRPLAQFLFAYKLRVSLVALLDVLSLAALEKYGAGATVSWILLVLSTVAQTVCSSMQFNAQMSFFSTRVDKNIGGR